MADAISLADELSQAIDASEETGEHNVAAPDTAVLAPDTASAAPAAEPSAADRARDEHGRFAKAATDASETAATGTETAATITATAAKEPLPETQVDLPPSTWTPEAKAEYEHLSPVIKAEMKKREADYQKGISQYKQLAGHGDVFQRAIQPYMPMIQAEGSDPVKSVTQLLNTAYRLRFGTPVERGQMVMAIAQQFGADLTPWMQRQAQADTNTPAGIDQAAIQRYVDQLVEQRTAPLQKYQQTLLNAQQQQEQAATAATQGAIEQFRTAVDEKGQAKHIYFDNVRPLMASLIESGSATTLDDAYGIACRAHPEVAKALDAERRIGENAQRLEEAKKKAGNARRAAAANVTGQGGIGVADTSKSSLRDELNAQYERTAVV